MTGREESARKIEEKLMQRIKICPKYVEDFYNMLNAEKLSHTTKARYMNYLWDFMDYLELDCLINVSDQNFVKEVKPSIINNYINTMSNLGNSIKASRLYGIKKFFDFCCNDDIIEKNPFDKIKIPKDDKEHEITALTTEEISILFENIDKGANIIRKNKYHDEFIIRDHAIVAMMLFLGLRVTSVIEINMDDINLDEKTIVVREKGGKTRTLEFSKGLRDDIKKWIDIREKILLENKVKMEPLFITSKLNRITTKAVSRMIERNTYNINKKISPHKLRSTCGTRAYNETGDIYVTAYILGHSSLKNTKRYAKISDDRKRSAIAAMDKILYK